MRSPFIKYDKDKFICPYCHKNLKVVYFEYMEIPYDTKGNPLPNFEYDLHQTKRIICDSCGMDITSKVIYDTENMKYKLKENKEVKRNKIINPFSGQEMNYDV